MAGPIKRIEELGSPKEPKKFDNPLGIPSAPLTAEAVQPRDKEEEKDLAKIALEDKEIRGWFEKQRDAINKEFKEKEKNVDKRRMIQNLTQAITQFGAAMSGQKAGVDLSNLNFIKQDFEKELDRAARKRTEDIGLAKEEMGSRRRLAELIRKREERKKERAEDVAFREKKLAASEQEAKAKAKATDKPRDFMNRSGDVIRVYPDGRTEVLQRGRAGDVQQARQELAERKQEHMEKEKDEPTPAQMEQLASFDEATKLLEKVKKEKVEDGLDTGPLVALSDFFRDKVGLQDPETAKLKQDVTETIAKKVKAISGAAASDKEREFLSFTLPRLRDNDEQFIAKLDNAIKNIELAKKARIEALTKGGRQVEQFKDETAPEMVEMTAPDGRALRVPASEVERLEKLGATRK